jgi:hypothetical protein
VTPKIFEGFEKEWKNCAPVEFGSVVALATIARNDEPTDSIAIGVDPSFDQGCEWFRKKSANFTWLYGESLSVAFSRCDSIRRASIKVLAECIPWSRIGPGGDQERCRITDGWELRPAAECCSTEQTEELVESP